MKEQFKATLREALDELEVSLEVDLNDLSAYMSQRALYLSTIVGLPGFPDALIAERDNVALEAGIQSVEAATAVDRQLLGVIQGALRIAAGALS